LPVGLSLAPSGAPALLERNRETFYVSCFKENFFLENEGKKFLDKNGQERKTIRKKWIYS
jgi:hypothetical protein